MTPAMLAWLQELRHQGRQGFDVMTLFRGVDPCSVIDAVRECDVQTVAPDSVLLEAGTANDTIYVLLSGRLAAHLDTALIRGVPISIDIGESVGEMSTIDGKPVSARVSAVTEARVLNLPGALFWSRIAGIPGVTRNLLASLSTRMRRANETMLEAQRRHLALEHLRRELQVARQLQASMIPGRGRLFPERRDIEVAGLANSASEVGGDFFDAFFVDDRHMFVCVGDVSGHGIPAALFMARTMGLIRIAAMRTRQPARLLEHLNQQLCSGNDANIFVTIFCAFLQVATGRLTFANAGHCAPLLAHEGRASRLPLPKGALVGVIPGLHYTANEMELQPGVALVCFTDGIPEAESKSGREFSQERLAAVVAAHSSGSVESLLDGVQRELLAFLDGVELADDCTLLGVRRPVPMLPQCPTPMSALG
jgi:sigma-B regulation protein RsbU (phosphoserine phosphatase)